MHRSTVSRHRWPAFLCAIFLLVAGLEAGAATNEPPTISGSPDTWVYVGTQYAFRPSSWDREGATLRFSIANKPAWASFSSRSGYLRGTPSAVGLWNDVRISVSDGTSTVTLPAFSIRAVSKSNAAPTISGAPATTATVGAAYSFQPSASDANSDPLRFSIANKPVWASFSTSTGELSGTPTIAQAGSYANVTISVSDGNATAALPGFSISVNAPANTAPVISGSPVVSVKAGSAYSFRPTASDANGDTLTFAVANLPSWASFSASTGQISGTPTAANVGSYSNIVITVSDGRASATLPGFAITVTDVSIGNATLSWTPPTANTDGSTLTTLAGYRIHYGVSAGQLTQTIQVANAGVSTYVVPNLSPGTYYFAVRAYTIDGTESDNSNVSTKIVQ